MKFNNKEHLRSAILGLVVGDALGVPYEFEKRDTFSVEGMTGYGTHHQPVGTWSDDSSMTLATLDSFIECEDFDYKDLMNRFVSWYQGEAYSPHNSCFDIGISTFSAISRFMIGDNPLDCGGKDRFDNGNGSLMRILPIAFVNHSDKDIKDLSSVTHAHQISCMCCNIYLQIVQNLMNGMSKQDAVSSLTGCVNECESIPQIGILSRNHIKSTGYVVDTLEAAIWCLINTDSYKACVTTAVELGNDTDTIAAVAGGLAGIYYGIGGENGIPNDWINQIVKLDYIEGLINRALNN